MRPLLVALGILLVVLGLFAMVERTWLAGLDRPTLRLLRITRGVLSILVLAAGVAWTILKASPGLLMESAVGEGWLTRPRLTATERIRIYAWWFICMRWIAFMLAAILVSASVWVVRWLPRDVWWPLLVAVVALAGLNVIYMQWLHRNVGLSFLLPVQAFVDVVVLIWLLHFSGGIENPLSAILVFHVIISGILLSRGQCYAIAATASGLFALVAWGEGAGILGHHMLLLSPHFGRGRQLIHLAQSPLYVLGSTALQVMVLFLTAYFVTTLGERMRNDERRLEVLAGRAIAGQQLLEQALATTGTGLRVLNSNLEPRWANHRWEEWFGPPPGSDSPAAKLLNEENSPARQCLQDGQVQVTELVVDPQICGSPPTARFGASQCVLQVTTAPLKDAAGRIQQIAELAENITQHKETQVRMVRAGKLAALGQLAGQIAHEVNNPLAMISGKARLLLSNCRQDMSAKIAQDLVKIAESAERVARIAQGLLSYYRPSLGDRVRLNVCVPIRKSLAMIEEPARRMGVVIQDALAATVLPVRANANELEQVFLNLFLNALDAMPTGGRLRVSAQSAPANGDSGLSAVIVVEDSGCGIADEIRERVFEPFFTTKPEGRGTGLGLAICQGLVQSHGGEIEVESALGKGTRLIVNLPIDAAAKSPEEPDHA